MELARPVPPLRVRWPLPKVAQSLVGTRALHHHWVCREATGVPEGPDHFRCGSYYPKHPGGSRAVSATARFIPANRRIDVHEFSATAFTDFPFSRFLFGFPKMGRLRRRPICSIGLCLNYFNDIVRAMPSHVHKVLVGKIIPRRLSASFARSSVCGAAGEHRAARGQHQTKQRNLAAVSGHGEVIPMITLEEMRRVRRTRNKRTLHGHSPFHEASVAAIELSFQSEARPMCTCGR